LRTRFHNQEKHDDFFEERKNQNIDEDVRMSSTFVIGQNMLVRVLLLKEGKKSHAREFASVSVQAKTR
jgi:hypothetical protein